MRIIIEHFQCLDTGVLKLHSSHLSYMLPLKPEFRSPQLSKDFMRVAVIPEDSLFVLVSRYSWFTILINELTRLIPELKIAFLQEWDGLPHGFLNCLLFSTASRCATYLVVRGDFTLHWTPFPIQYYNVDLEIPAL
ncbi:hypothetical protein TNCV_4685191 [Trichonephila clavipes]|nr:hypothetical protein TNCV_4685191 [Trichonephila clavipes]